MYSAKTLSQFGYLLCASFLTASAVHAAGEVSSIETSEQLGTPFQYEVNGETYSWGIGTNEILESVTVDGRRYAYANAVDRVELRRDDISDLATGIPCGVFVERQSASNLILEANYPSEANGSGNCDMAEMLASRIVNRGALDVFSNKLPNPKNIERVDYVFDYGVLAPLSTEAMEFGGHLAAEKRGNNSIQIAAILSIDVLGQPTAYGPLVRINPFGCSADQVCYGVTSVRHNYSFFQSSSIAPQSYPEYLTDTTESVSMAYISAKQLGLGVGQKYYGFSFFPEDVDGGVHNLLDPASFPNDTADDNILIGDGADIYGGLSAYFLADEISVASGKVFNDEDLDQTFDEVESGISGIGISLYIDSNGDGVLDPSVDQQLGSSFESNQTGDFVLPGLPDGTYFLQVDESDEDIPPGLYLPDGTNPLMFVISSADQGSLDFPFTDGVAPPDDGTNTAGNTGGNSTSGTSGGSDSGSSTSGSTGGSDSGNNTSGSTGGSDSGNNTSGSTGGSDSGNNSSGSTGGSDSGNNTSGSTGGSDSGNNTSGSTGGSDSGNNTSGSTDDGNASGGGSGTTDLGTDSGTTDSGSTAGTDSGTADSGSSDSGTSAGTDSGTSDNGSTDAGTSTGTDSGTDSGNTAGTDSGTADSGNTDSGSTDAGTDSGETDGTGGDGMNPDGTVATPDTATVDQGETVIIPVLDNDIDSTGGGLTIISFTDAPNGTVDRSGTGLSYSPDFGFYGIDTFMYTIEDTAGNQATGTVTIEVIRYSDINDNNLNDYDECNCVSLTLESGIHGSGLAGSFEWLSVFALFGALVLRRGRSSIRFKGSRA